MKTTVKIINVNKLSSLQTKYVPNTEDAQIKMDLAECPYIGRKGGVTNNKKK